MDKETRIGDLIALRSGTEIANATEALSISTSVLARAALGQGVTRETAYQVLTSVAEAIRDQDCAEDMSPIRL